MKKIVYTIGILLCTLSTMAQDLSDALRYSNYHMTGTARSAAMGNAFGALGGDFSSLSINPAGIAVYRSGEFTFTPSFSKTNIDGTYLGNTISDSKYNIGIENIGYISSFKSGTNSESGVVSLSFGLGFNRLGNFSMNSLAEGANSNHSLLTYFTENVNNPLIDSDDFDPYYEKLAWDTYLINYDEDNKEYFNDITDNGHGQSQRKSTNRKGHIDEYVLSLGANFNHKFYLGGTLGIHEVIFREDGNLYEFDAKNNIPYFNNFDFNTYLKTSGTGVNAKVGAIYKPVDAIRLGVAFHTPTFYRFTDRYNSGMKSSITYLSDGQTEISDARPDQSGIYKYWLETPMKTILSGAVVIGKIGLLSVDYEIVNFASARLKHGSDGYDYYYENLDIADAYKTVGNLHIGGELRVSKSLSLRGGYENFPSAYQSTYQSQASPNSNTNYTTISGGFGFRQGNFFLDAALKHQVNDEYSKLYPGAINMAHYETSKDNLIFTLGFKF